MITLADHEHRVEIADIRPHHPLVAPDPATAPPWYERRGKRLVDLAVAATLIVVLAPLMLAVMALARMSLGPGVILRQRRTGLHGRDFTMFKVRTMLADRRRFECRIDHPDRRMTHKSADDPRHTTLGRALRRSCLDELPQLFNVVRGDMSMVGPRPELAEIVDARLLRTHPRHGHRPGITGAWQLGRRNDGAPLHDCFDDESPPTTLGSDIAMILATPRVMWRRAGS